MNEFVMAEDWSARLLLPSGYRYGIELFSVYGGTSDIVGFDDDQHAVGPFMTVPLAPKWTLFAGALFALDGDAPDSNLRLWVNRSF